MERGLAPKGFALGHRAGTLRLPPPGARNYLKVIGTLANSGQGTDPLG
jgi:hypothetical protein